MRHFGIAVLTAAAIAVPGCTLQQNPADTDPVAPAATSTPAAPDPPHHTGYVDLVERLGPSIVTVERSGGVGSGVVLRSDTVVTNAHVVGDAPRVTIVFADGIRSSGEVLATDTVTDLAVVRTERTNLPVPEFRTDLPEPGEIAVAIGSPLGFENSVSAGVISGIHRDIPGTAPQAQSLVDLIQTDASISPGSSGGALLDTSGRVVGINEAYIPPITGAVSLGFAIPSPTVLDVTDQLLTEGSATHPYLGVSVRGLTPQLRERLDIRADHGALVVGVDDGAPAAAADIRPGDVIVELAGDTVRAVEDLLGALRDLEPESRQSLTLLRDGETHRVTLTIGSRTG
ncbi:trypsin-like peptidase domain-containing protein [Nocardia otitidiscaviarum]|uniref:S1C family serine protease n=1 Tax=Nocardia otitidiscaviarum TaxID=1823 RepID=UPI0004A6ABE2|nr:trypsin-like peptidase domain-containing protein [Nocardia otitidiscaviarum]MBF6134711.1 trypsin-like peptidase domain-containing protein [Nocardia otitidiscaviarum]MBF6485663.1 trypsin-like peptidase domain-containing protein [Nocardia otitidiscaviarum]